MLSGCKVTTFLRDRQIFENKNSKPPHRLKWLGIRMYQLMIFTSYKGKAI